MDFCSGELRIMAMSIRGPSALRSPSNNGCSGRRQTAELQCGWTELQRVTERLRRLILNRGDFGSGKAFQITSPMDVSKMSCRNWMDFRDFGSSIHVFHHYKELQKWSQSFPHPHHRSSTETVTAEFWGRERKHRHSLAWDLFDILCYHKSSKIYVMAKLALPQESSKVTGS